MPHQRLPDRAPLPAATPPPPVSAEPPAVGPREAAASARPGSSPRAAAANANAGLGELDAATRPQSGPAAPARQAASVILVREGTAGSELELLLVKRNPEARFMGGVWVFPGGAVDAEDGDGEGDPAHRAAAVRELAEEAGIAGVDPGSLVKFSRWITPAELAVRFDTHFFIARLPDDAPPARVDGRECVALEWFTAQSALDAHGEGRILLVFPTIRQLEQMRGFTEIAALVDHAGSRRITTARPRIVVSGEAPRVVMPGEPGYEGPG